MVNYNQKIRQELYKRYAIKGISDLELEYEVIVKIEKMLLNSSVEEEVKKVLLKTTGYIDLYKLLKYKQSKLELGSYEEKTFLKISKIKDYDELEQNIKYNTELLLMLIKSIYEFQDKTALGKILIMKNLTEEDNKKLSSMSIFHEEDMKTYITNLDIEYYKKYYLRSINLRSEEQIKTEIINFIKELAVLSSREYEENILELATIDFLNSEEETKTTKIYETSSLEQLLLLSLKDKEYLKEILETSLFESNQTREILLTEQAKQKVNQYKLQKNKAKK